MERIEIIKRMRWIFFVPNDVRLMDILQDKGMVADEAITIDEVCDRDLIRVYQQLLNV